MGLSETCWKAAAVLSFFALFASPALSVSFESPVDESQNTLPVSYCDTSTSDQTYFQVSYQNSDFPNSNFQLDIRYKEGDSTNWDRTSSLAYEDSFDDTNDLYFGDLEQTFQVTDKNVSDGSNVKTVTIGGEEVTFEVIFDDSSYKPDDSTNLAINGVGQIVDEGEFVQVNGEYVFIEEVSGTSDVFGASEEVEFEHFKPEDFSGADDYQLINDDTGTALSEVKTLNCRDDYSQIRVYSDGQRLIAGGNRKQVDVGSTVRYELNNVPTVSGLKEYDAVLQDGTGTEVDRINVSETSDGVVSAVTTDFVKTLGSVLLDFELDGDSVVLNPADSSDQHSQIDTNYGHQARIAGGGGHILTGYKTETSGNNDVPSIQAVEGYTGSSWKSLTQFGYEDLTKIRVKVSDSNNDRVDVVLNLTNEYDQEIKFENAYYNSTSGSSPQVYVFDLNSRGYTGIKDSGKWSYDVLVDDSIDSVNQSDTWNVSFGSLSLTNYQPSSDITVNETYSFFWKLGVRCSSGECVNEDENLTVYPDPVFSSCSSSGATCLANNSNKSPITYTGFRPSDSENVTWEVEAQEVDSNTQDEFYGYGNTTGSILTGNVTSSSFLVTVNDTDVNSAPNPSFSFSPSSPVDGEIVDFDGSGSSDPDGDTLSYSWSFGDGTSDSGQKVSHTYSSSGNYSVELQVSDGSLTDSVTKVVEVSSSTSDGGGGGGGGSGGSGGGDGDDNSTDTGGDDSDGDSGGTGATGGTTTIIRRVNSSEYQWFVRAEGTRNAQAFTKLRRPGQRFTESIVVENTGTQSVTLELACISSQTGACDQVQLSRQQLQLNTTAAEKQREVEISYRVPRNASPGQVYQFSIEVTDPTYTEGQSGGRALVDFEVSVNQLAGFLFNTYGRALELGVILGLPVPFFVYPFLLALLTGGSLLGVGRLFRTGRTVYYQLAVFALAALVFVVGFPLLGI